MGLCNGKASLGMQRFSKHSCKFQIHYNNDMCEIYIYRYRYIYIHNVPGVWDQQIRWTMKAERPFKEVFAERSEIQTLQTERLKEFS